MTTESIITEDQPLTGPQEAAFDKLLESGGDSKWVRATDIAHHQTIKALLNRRMIQTTEIDGYQHVAFAGIIIDEHSMEDL